MKKNHRSAPRALFVAALLLAFFPLAAAAQHSVTLSNGDRMTGTFSGIDGGVWKFDYLGQTQNIPVGDIASVTIDSPLGWRLADGTLVAGTLTASGGSGTIGLEGGQTRPIALTDLAAMGSPDDLEALVPIELGFFSPFDQFWSAVASLGISDKSGNSRARGFSLGLLLERKTDRDRLEATWSWVREEAPDATGSFATTVSRISASLRGELFASDNLFGFLQTRFERDRFQFLSGRSSNNLGLGLRLVANDETDFRVSLSGGFQYERYLPIPPAVVAAPGQTNAIGTLGTVLAQQLGPAVFRWQTELTGTPKDLNDYRFRSVASLSIGVLEGLGFQVGVTNEYDNIPQAAKKHDMLITTNFTYTLGR